MSRRFKVLTFGALMGAVALFVGGCVYLRLLEVKYQMGDFDRNFRVQTDDGVRITCVKPVLLADDILWLGLVPENVRRVGTAEQWRVRWIKQLPPTVHEDGAFDIVVELLFVEHKLTRVSIPERYFAVMPKSLLIDLLRSLGGAKVNRDARSIEAQLAATRPNLPGIQKLLGRPSSECTSHGETTFRYKYVPVTQGGVAGAAVFDMAVHFDDATGEMTRWEGQTPVGRIGFNFASSNHRG